MVPKSPPSQTLSNGSISNTSLLQYDSSKHRLLQPRHSFPPRSARLTVISLSHCCALHGFLAPPPTAPPALITPAMTHGGRLCIQHCAGGTGRLGVMFQTASLMFLWSKLCRHPISSVALPLVIIIRNSCMNPPLPPHQTHSCLGIHLLLLLIAHLKSQATVERIITE